ncbi:hypothetical protein KC19_12G039400 [Ceratodon purpureus]|uniref:Uncharacterized protein n=1 Tax=Ceratodon purpureus TaxID=3225 RepID=A0A8T0G4I5_CERPU|nr:hypothetical protein KC19_12G039400 [Ceratodon purpureus]
MRVHTAPYGVAGGYHPLHSYGYACSSAGSAGLKRRAVTIIPSRLPTDIPPPPESTARSGIPFPQSFTCDLWTVRGHALCLRVSVYHTEPEILNTMVSGT